MTVGHVRFWWPLAGALRSASRGRTPVTRSLCWLRSICWVSIAATLITLAGAGSNPLAQQTAGSAPPRGVDRGWTSPPHEGWPTNGGDWYNRRYSPLTQITRDNVASLKAVWRTQLGGSGMEAQFSGEAQPIVVDGVIYLATGADDVVAIDVESGAIRWTYRSNLDPANSVVCCGWTNRGVAIGEGQVFLGRLDGQLVALDQRSGAVTWSIQAERWQEGFSITSAPLYYDGLVITGFAGAEFGVRGRVKAFHAKDGSPAWTFYTVPGPGEIGHETWPANNDAWKRGGATVWQTPALDPALGLLFFSTGNPGPDFDGSVRAGNNLFSSSIVAIEVRTGKYRWHFQQVHHDIWDYDSPSPVVLFDIAVGGRMRQALAQPSKTGWVYILDRVTGKPLVGVNERAVPQEARQKTAATQPYPIGDAFVPQSVAIAPEGFRLVNQGRIFTPFWKDAVVAKPGQSGGANWPASAYDLDTGYLYVCASDRTGVFKGGDAASDTAKDGDRYLGGVFGNIPYATTGIYAAMDMRTNRIVWQQQWPERCYSGSVATAAGLLLVGRSDGRLTALDARNGSLLWAFQTGAGVNAPASVFQYRGQEYIVVYSAGNLFAGSSHGDSVWLFSLQGQLGQVQSPIVAAPAAATNLAADLARGRAIFNSTCSACHGVDGRGGQGGPALTRATDLANVSKTVTGGRDGMPAFTGTLTPDEIRDVSAHVVQTVIH